MPLPRGNRRTVPLANFQTFLHLASHRCVQRVAWLGWSSDSTSPTLPDGVGSYSIEYFRQDSALTILRMIVPCRSSGIIYMPRLTPSGRTIFPAVRQFLARLLMACPGERTPPSRCGRRLEGSGTPLIVANGSPKRRTMRILCSCSSSLSTLALGGIPITWTGFAR